jgi:hypothetical protein
VSVLYLRPEMGDDGSGPVIILIFLLYVLAGAALVAAHSTWPGRSSPA